MTFLGWFDSSQIIAAARAVRLLRLANTPGVSREDVEKANACPNDNEMREALMWGAAFAHLLVYPTRSTNPIEVAMACRTELTKFEEELEEQGKTFDGTTTAANDHKRTR